MPHASSGARTRRSVLLTASITAGALAALTTTGSAASSTATPIAKNEIPTRLAECATSLGLAHGPFVYYDSLLNGKSTYRQGKPVFKIKSSSASQSGERTYTVTVRAGYHLCFVTGAKVVGRGHTVKKLYVLSPTSQSGDASTYVTKLEGVVFSGYKLKGSLADQR